MTEPRRPSASELAAQSDGQQPMQISGKPADVCPYCGAAMFIYGTQTLQSRVNRYVACRNCHKRFVSSQPPTPPAKIVREVGGDDSDIVSMYKIAQ